MWVVYGCLHPWVGSTGCCSVEESNGRRASQTLWGMWVDESVTVKVVHSSYIKVGKPLCREIWRLVVSRDQGGVQGLVRSGHSIPSFLKVGHLTKTKKNMVSIKQAKVTNKWIIYLREHTWRHLTHGTEASSSRRVQHSLAFLFFTVQDTASLGHGIPHWCFWRHGELLDLLQPRSPHGLGNLQLFIQKIYIHNEMYSSSCKLSNLTTHLSYLSGVTKFYKNKSCLGIPIVQLYTKFAAT